MDVRVAPTEIPRPTPTHEFRQISARGSFSLRRPAAPAHREARCPRSPHSRPRGFRARPQAVRVRTGRAPLRPVRGGSDGHFAETILLQKYSLGNAFALSAE